MTYARWGVNPICIGMISACGSNFVTEDMQEEVRSVHDNPDLGARLSVCLAQFGWGYAAKGLRMKDVDGTRIVLDPPTPEQGRGSYAGVVVMERDGRYEAYPLGAVVQIGVSRSDPKTLRSSFPADIALGSREYERICGPPYHKTIANWITSGFGSDHDVPDSCRDGVVLPIHESNAAGSAAAPGDDLAPGLELAFIYGNLTERWTYRVECSGVLVDGLWRFEVHPRRESGSSTNQQSTSSQGG